MSWRSFRDCSAAVSEFVIRCVHPIRRKPGSTPAEFSAHWCEQHGPLVASHQSRLNMVRYVQTHRDVHAGAAEIQAGAKRGGLEPPYDGIEEFWFQSERALQSALDAEPGRRALREITAHEARFVDLAASPVWFAHEYPQINTRRERIVARPKTGLRKVYFALRPPTLMSTVEAKRYWQVMHGPLVRAHAVARGVLCYQQVHRFETPLADEWSALRCIAVDPYMGHAEAWFDALASAQGGESADAEAAAIDDERHFIDWSRSSLLLGKEFVFVDRDWL